MEGIGEMFNTDTELYDGYIIKALGNTVECVSSVDFLNRIYALKIEDANRTIDYSISEWPDGTYLVARVWD